MFRAKITTVAKANCASSYSNPIPARGIVSARGRGTAPRATERLPTMRTSLGVTATILTGLALSGLVVMRKVRRLEQDLEKRWARFQAGRPEVSIDLSGPAIEIDHLKKEARILYIHQT